MSKRVIYFFIILIVAVFILGGFFYCQNWWNIKQTQIKLGLAENKFPYRNYSAEEMAEMYPQIKNADVPTRVTPEQTYANFREALRTNNLEMAIEQLSKESERYGENESDLEQAHKDNRFQEIHKNYPEVILKENMAKSISQYYFNYKEDKQEKTHFMNFIKDFNGDWKIDSL